MFLIQVGLELAEAPHLHKSTPHHITTLHTSLHCTTLHCTTPHHTTLHHITPHHTTLHHITLHHTTPHHTAPHHMIPLNTSGSLEPISPCLLAFRHTPPAASAQTGWSDGRLGCCCCCRRPRRSAAGSPGGTGPQRGEQQSQACKSECQTCDPSTVGGSLCIWWGEGRGRGWSSVALKVGS